LPPAQKEGALGTLNRSTLITLGWQSWSVVAVVVTMVLLTLLLFH
jgi:hypothetical protein